MKLDASEITLNAEEFWRFSCDFYGKPQAFALLHKLQDCHNQNINRWLLVLWLVQNRLIICRSGNPLFNNQSIKELESWIALIRMLRDQLKNHQADVLRSKRQKVLSLELRLEKVHQQTLIAVLHLSQAISRTPHSKEQTCLQNLELLDCGKNVPQVFVQQLLSLLPDNP